MTKFPNTKFKTNQAYKRLAKRCLVKNDKFLRTQLSESDLEDDDYVEHLLDSSRTIKNKALVLSFGKFLSRQVFTEIKTFLQKKFNLPYLKHFSPERILPEISDDTKYAILHAAPEKQKQENVYLMTVKETLFEMFDMNMTNLNDIVQNFKNDQINKETFNKNRESCSNAEPLNNKDPILNLMVEDAFDDDHESIFSSDRIRITTPSVRSAGRPAADFVTPLNAQQMLNAHHKISASVSAPIVPTTIGSNEKIATPEPMLSVSAQNLVHVGEFPKQQIGDDDYYDPALYSDTEDSGGHEDKDGMNGLPNGFVKSGIDLITSANCFDDSGTDFNQPTNLITSSRSDNDFVESVKVFNENSVHVHQTKYLDAENIDTEYNDDDDDDGENNSSSCSEYSLQNRSVNDDEQNNLGEEQNAQSSDSVQGEYQKTQVDVASSPPPPMEVDEEVDEDNITEADIFENFPVKESIIEQPPSNNSTPSLPINSDDFGGRLQLLNQKIQERKTAVVTDGKWIQTPLELIGMMNEMPPPKLKKFGPTAPAAWKPAPRKIFL